MSTQPKQLEFSLDAINVRERLHDAEFLINELAAYMRSSREDPRSPHKREVGNYLYKRALKFVGRGT